jgi:hypothetical protein
MKFFVIFPQKLQNFGVYFHDMAAGIVASLVDFAMISWWLNYKI